MIFYVYAMRYLRFVTLAHGEVWTNINLVLLSKKIGFASTEKIN